MFLGFLLGLLIYLISPSETEFIIFNENLFFFALLPPIVFDAGYSMKRTNFFRNMYSILLYAIIGTIISTFVIGYGVYLFAKAGAIDVPSDSPLDALIFGALISSIDPIATLAILGNKSLNVPPLLYSLVFGESVLNDAIAITLFQTFKDFRGVEFSSTQVFKALGIFVGVSVGSVLLGAAFALISAAILRKVNFTAHPSNEFIIIFFFAYACYCVAEIAHLSGIIALFACGVMQAHYAWYNISNVSRTTTRHAFHSFAHICEAFLYAYLGITAVLCATPVFKDKFEWSWQLIIFGILLCVLGRALNIFPLSALANCGRKTKIPFKQQVLMWFSGLRGAISFALALSMDSTEEGSSKYVTSTMAIIIITTLIMGGMSNFILGALGLGGPANPPPAHPSTRGGEGGGAGEVQMADSFMVMPEADHGESNLGHDDDDVHHPNGSSSSSSSSSGAKGKRAHGLRTSVTFADGGEGQGSNVGVGNGTPKLSRQVSNISNISRRNLTPEDANMTEQERADAIIERRRARKVRTGSTSGGGGQGEKLGWLHDLWIRFDVHYMQPWFGGKYAPRMDGDEAEEDNSQMPNPYLAPNVEQVEEDPEENKVVEEVAAQMHTEEEHKQRGELSQPNASLLEAGTATPPAVLIGPDARTRTNSASMLGYLIYLQYTHI